MRWQTKGKGWRKNYKKELIAHWKYRSEHERYLWQVAAEDIYIKLKKNTPREAYEYFKKEAKKRREMAISGYYNSAMKMVKPLMYKTVVYRRRM